MYIVLGRDKIRIFARIFVLQSLRRICERDEVEKVVG